MNSFQNLSADTGRLRDHLGPRLLPRPYLDCLVFFLLPAIINVSSIPDFGLTRISISALFIMLLMKNVFVYSAISPLWKKRVDVAFMNVFSTKNKIFLVFILFLGLLIVSEMRGALIGTSSPFGAIGLTLWLGSILGYLLSVTVLNASQSSRTFLLLSLVGGLGLFVAVNVVAYFFGLRGFNSLDNVGQNETLALIGISVSRVALPFASGVNNFGAIAGLTVVLGFCVVRYGEGLWKSLLGLVVSSIGVVGIALVDSRASIILSLFTCALILVVPAFRFGMRALRWTPLVVLIAPVIVLAVFFLIRDTDLAAYFVREGNFAQRLGLLTARDVVWKSAYDILAQGHPLHIVGYGIFGQITSGATQDYSWVFGRIAGQTATTLHNANLQIVFDIGYIGLIIWIIFWVLLMTRVSRSLLTEGKSLYATVMAASAVFIALSGVFEVGGTIYYPDMFVVLMLLVAWSVPGIEDSEAALLRQQ